MRTAVFSALCGIGLVTLAAAQVQSADDAAVQNTCRRLENLAKLCGEGFGEAGTYESLEVKPSTEKAGVYRFEMKVKDNNEQRLNRCHLTAGQALGVLLDKGEDIQGAVIMKSPDKIFAGTLPVTVCREMGKQLLAEPRDMSAIQDAILKFAITAELFEVKPK